MSLRMIKEKLFFTLNFYGNEDAPYFPLQLTISTALHYGFSEAKLVIMNTNVIQIR